MLTGIVIAKNEEKNLPLCLPLLKFCSQVIVVDNGSSDKTRDIAKNLGAKVIRFPASDDYSAIRNFALSQAATKWVLFVDADELVSPELASEITTSITKIEYKGFFIPRVDFLWGKQLRFGDIGSVKLLRLGRRGAGEWQGKIHETWKITGRVGTLHHPFLHYPHPTLADFLKSVNRYSSLRAKELHTLGAHSNLAQIVFYPLLKFFYLWIVKRGFLDGTAGFIHAMIMALYSFLVRAKLYLLSQNIPNSTRSE